QLDTYRPAQTKPGTRRSDRNAGNAANPSRWYEPPSRLSTSSGRVPTIGWRIACGIASRASSSIAFARGSVVVTEPGFTQPHEKSMTILYVSMFQRFPGRRSLGEGGCAQ